ncbi:MAG: non-homologous end-joining DNA ligase [Armatimonadetes bacterium]|nr:non-homologous end-joining DNA ligase [Armatimonadota bacterium]
MLEEYRQKRDFGVTNEPAGGVLGPTEGPLRYSVQMHDATRLHWDLRLECQGALWCFAVPKGFSRDPHEKHLAVHVEDHPLEYLRFEAVIPPGQYGAGPINVWDAGIYTPDEGGVLAYDNRAEAEKRMVADFAAGKLSITFRGAKLRGSYTLVKTKTDWLLIKHQDSFVKEGEEFIDDPASVLSGMTLPDLEAAAAGSYQPPMKPEDLKGAVRSPGLKNVHPMLCSDLSAPPSGDQWLVEPKLDGIRCIAYYHGDSARLQSRNGLDISYKFPGVTRELAWWMRPDMVLDGEIVSIDANGLPNFGQLMQRFQLGDAMAINRAEAAQPVEFWLFDILYYGGWDLRGVALRDRRKFLESLGLRGFHTKLVSSFVGNAQLVHEHSVKVGFEGIVVKKLDSTYKEGVRSNNWQKIKKSHSDEFVIGGYTRGSGMRAATFGSLILGRKDEKGLTWVGSVGSGFSDADLQDIRKKLDTIRASSSPFNGPIEGESPTWVEPILVAEVQFQQMTADDKMRFPVFKRLRLDLMEAPPAAQADDPQAPTGSGKADVIHQLSLDHQKDFSLNVEGQILKITNPKKVLWPEFSGNPPVTKLDLLRYYARVSDDLLRHTRGRPMSYVRGPNGITGELFFQKHLEQGRPDFIRTIPIYSSHNNRTTDYPLCDSLPALMWFGQLGTLELHPWYSRVDLTGDGIGHHADTGSSEQALESSILDFPDFMVIDLDPYVYSGEEKEGQEPELNPKAFRTTVSVALELREMLKVLGLEGFLKTTGKTGLHIFIPIVRNIGYDAVRLLCETLGRQVMAKMPDEVTMEWSVKKRPAKVFFDHNQNVRGKTLAGIYSPRPIPFAGVSFPVSWEDLPTVYPTDFTIWNVPDYLEARGDLWAGILDAKQDLRKILGG